LKSSWGVLSDGIIFSIQQFLVGKMPFLIFSLKTSVFKDLITPDISACRKIDKRLLIKALFIS
jgi:hypothetical protein